MAMTFFFTPGDHHEPNHTSMYLNWASSPTDVKLICVGESMGENLHNYVDLT